MGAQPVVDVLLTGATGYVGGRTLPGLLASGHGVRCLVRRPEAVRLDPRAQVVRGDVTDAESLRAALDGVRCAFYLVHSMGAHGDFAARDREAALTFGRAAREAGVGRVVYLGGLGGGPDAASAHLRSREEVATILDSHVSELVHVRAAMVIGAQSTSFLMLRHLVSRLPFMICPRWVQTRTQPVAIRDVAGVLTRLADTGREAPPELQVGGADVLAYGEMIDRTARLMGRRPPVKIPVPLLSPVLSSYWVGFVTPIDAAVARPLVQGLGEEMVVTDPPPAGFNDAPLGFDAAVRAALAEAG
jgi:uncharacterized protein YbjT (DUF2867 family)